MLDIELDATMFSDQDALRFWSYVARRGEDECWYWCGSLSSGYGQFSLQGVLIKAHRGALVLAYDVVLRPKDFVCHQLYCPHTDCCNPKHLYLGDARSNRADRIAALKHPHLVRPREDDAVRDHIRTEHILMLHGQRKDREEYERYRTWCEGMVRDRMKRSLVRPEHKDYRW